MCMKQVQRMFGHETDCYNWTSKEEEVDNVDSDIDIVLQPKHYTGWGGDSGNAEIGSLRMMTTSKSTGI